MTEQNNIPDFEGIESVEAQPELSGCQKSTVMILTIILTFVGLGIVLALIVSVVEDASQLSNAAYGGIGFFMLGMVAVINRVVKAIVLRFSGTPNTDG